MEEKKSLAVFQDKKIRRIWHNNEWYFSVVDVVEVLTESPTPRQYWGKLKDREFNQLETSPIWVQLKLPAPDGKLRETDCANTESMFRIIQSIPSPKAEPFKLWLAKGLEENKQAAQRGGKIAHNARNELEQETKKTVVSKDNFLNLNERKKLGQKKKK
ncbi:Bro-N domain-containing protein [Candidatus Woesearchaeota archaeon]|nr:Bro-N domain-containing protein [Candidatus Woesearchaeota archaeon]